MHFFTPRECTRLLRFPNDFVVPTENDSNEIRAHYEVNPIVVGSIFLNSLFNKGSLFMASVVYTVTYV